jgi:DamX protein
MMDNMNEPENQGHPDPGFRSLENKVSTLERQIAEQQDQLRDYEKSLVERIGDVDDDRRTTASQLQRAWQSQLEAINDRLRRHRVIVFGALVLFLVVVGVVLFLANRQANIDRQLLADDLAALKQEPGRTSGNPADAESVRAELTRLSAAVNEITSSRGRQDEMQADRLYTLLEDERIARKEADAVISAEVQRLEAKQESLLRELETLREALQTPEATKAESGDGLPDSSPAEDARQDSAQEPVAATVEPPVEFSPTSPTEGVSRAVETPAATAEQTFGDDPGKALSDASPDAETPQTLVVADHTYALQLIGFYSWDALLRFADRNDLPERLYYREETVQGRPWFALIHSLHADYASASAELHDLSPELVAMDPWIRPIGAGVELTVLDTGSKRRP